jgi:Subtilisin inhibitor-like
VTRLRVVVAVTSTRPPTTERDGAVGARANQQAYVTVKPSVKLRPLIPIAVMAGLAGCGHSTVTGPTRLTVVVHGTNRGTPWHTTWTLHCSPPGGSHPTARKSCAALTDLLTRHAVPPRHCSSEAGGPWTTVHGLYRGDPLSLAYAEACATGNTSLEAQAVGAYFGHGYTSPRPYHQESGSRLASPWRSPAPGHRPAPAWSWI